MFRAIALTLGLLGGLGLTACRDYDDELFEYCAKQGTCECEGGNCCAARNQPCALNIECCAGTFCSTRPTALCEGPVVLEFEVLTPPQQRVWPKEALKEFRLRNFGPHASLPLQFEVVEGAGAPFQLDASDCAGKPLASDATCLLKVTNTLENPWKPGDPGFPAPDLFIRIRASEQGGAETDDRIVLLPQAVKPPSVPQ